MKNRAINKNERRKFFDSLARMTQGELVEIEVASLDIGDQVAEEWARLDGLTYDWKEDILYINTPAFEHSIIKPEEILVVQNDLAVNAIFVKDADGHVQSVKFRNPLMLPAPEKHEHP